MAIRAVVFDIGGVLEITPDLGIPAQWEPRLGLPSGELHRHLADVWAGSVVGSLTEAQMEQAITDRLGLTEPQLAAFMADLWREYLGTANTELIDYARGLRPRYRTGIVSNSMVGAREREQAAYGFAGLVDDLVYSHEAGICKPDTRIYMLACTRLNVRPDQTLFLDDKEHYVTGAREAGLHALHYRDNAEAIADIERLLASP